MRRLRPANSRVIHLRTLRLGQEELLVAAKISVGAAAVGRDIAAAIDDAESGMRAAVPKAQVIYLEPDLHREDGQHPGRVPGQGQVSDAARISAEAGPQDTQA